MNDIDMAFVEGDVRCGDSSSGSEWNSTNGGAMAAQ